MSVRGFVKASGSGGALIAVIWLAVSASHVAAQDGANLGLLGLPACSDNIDNDGDGGTDHDGGILGLPPDPACASPSQNTEGGGGPACALCVDFVTTYNPPGPADPKTRMHRNVIANVPYALDVDGGNAPNALGALPTLPGYEVRVTVEGLDATHPTIRIEKLLGAPATLPLRIEVLTGNQKKTSFGYDTLESTAPQSFVANLDLRDRDGHADTSQARAAMTIAGAGERLTVVNEEFTGDPVGGRSERSVNRLEFSGDPASGTRVPGNVVVDYTATSAPAPDTGEPETVKQHLILSHSQRTVLGFELLKPDGSSTTGTVDELPADTEVTIADEDVNADGEDDTKIDYTGSAPVDSARVATDDGKQATTDALIEGIPAGNTSLTLASAPEESADDFTEITYHAPGRADSAHVATTTPGEEPGSEPLELTVDVTNLPANIGELTHTSKKNGGNLVYLSDASADRADLSTRQGDAEFDANLTGLPEDVSKLTYKTPTNQVVLDYLASDTLDHGVIRIEDVLEEDSDPDHRREISATVEGLAPEFFLDLDTLAKTVDYTASAVIPEVTLEGTDEAPFFERAKTLDLLLEDIPADVDATLSAEHMLFDAHGERLGLVEFAGRQSRFGGDDLESGVDGFLLRDLTNRYDIVAHSTGLEFASFDRPNDDETHIALRSDAGPPLDVDVLRDGNHEVWTNRFDDEDGTHVRQHISRPGRETLTASMPSHPAAMNLDLLSGETGLDLDYTSDESRSFMLFERKMAFSGADVPIVYDSELADERLPDAYPPSDFDTRQLAHLDPMPRVFNVCQNENNNDCTEDVFTDEDPDMFSEFSSESANGGSARIQSIPRTDMTFSDVGVEDTEFLYTPTQEDFCADGPGGVEICAHLKDNKPAQAINTINLDIESFAVQSHQEDSGFVGDLIGYPDQGYVAMDTDWTETEPIPGCEIFPANQFCSAFEGHLPPPEDARLTGLVKKTGGHLLTSEFLGEDPADGFYRFSPITDAVNLQFGDQFAADHRIFEGDPDELIFAKTWNGHVYCDDDTDLEGNGTDFTDNFCSGEIPLPEDWEAP